jgi:hypothetical protein
MKIIFGKYKGLVTLITRRTIQDLNLKCEIITISHCQHKKKCKCSWNRYRKELLFETGLSVIMTVLKVQNRKRNIIES